VRRSELRAGARLNVIETLRAAAPWQPLRRRETLAAHGADRSRAHAPRVQVRSEDFRVTRFKQHTCTTTIFVVDASGSAALHRLAEAKGAVELLLADCYVRRDNVALIGFRGRGAELLLPPTRSLVRARRSLAGLPGGGGTPLAAGIGAALALADAVRRKGDRPVVVLLTDGRANVTRSGEGGRAQAEEEALGAARLLRGAGIAALLIDTSPRAHPLAQRLAGEMRARYLPLPYADAATVSRAVQAASPAHA
jgi:magnesium chelatase subunit D